MSFFQPCIYCPVPYLVGASPVGTVQCFASSSAVMTHVLVPCWVTLTLLPEGEAVHFWVTMCAPIFFLIVSCTLGPYFSVSWFRMTMAWGWRVLHHLDAFVLSLTSPFMGAILYIYAHEICKLCAVDCTSQRPALQAVPNFLQLVWLKSLLSGTWLV